MEESHENHTGTFEAVGSDGETYAVLEFTNDIDAGTLSDPHAVVGGLKEFRTSGGLAVNRMSKGARWLRRGFLFVLIPQMRRNTAEEAWYRVAGHCP